MTNEEKQRLYDKLERYIEGTDNRILGYIKLDPIKVMGDRGDMMNMISLISPILKFGDKYVYDPQMYTEGEDPKEEQQL